LTSSVAIGNANLSLVLKNYASNHKEVILQNCIYPKLIFLLSLLPCLSFVTLFSFQGAIPGLSRNQIETIDSLNAFDPSSSL